MSNVVTLLCRAVQLPPTQKAVLMCLADYCHDDGRDWHSIAALMSWTCLGKTTVIDALKALEARGLIAIERRNGAKSTTFLRLQAIEASAPTTTENQNATRTGMGGGPVRVADSTGAGGVQTGAAPVQTGAGGAPEALEASEKHLEASGKARAKRTSADKPALPCPDSVDQQVWSDWLELRRRKRAPVTQTVVDGADTEAKAAGMTLEAFLRVWCVRGSQGLQADWLKPHERGQADSAWRRPRAFAGTNFNEGVGSDGRII